MNAKTLIAAAFAATFAAGAFAQEATFDDANFVAQAKSTLSRAQVQADVQQARADGTYVAGGEATLFADTPAVSQRTRAEVRNEAIAAAAARRASHQIDVTQIGA
ncbi:MAG: DUF4148 domain-containing protein [Acidovorax temperans]|mgnify:CR=1 FL=1|jgi:hypothetical protein|uniref:DUF4148 domain-containing protein n=1 Tax=Acidovorax temperans TaxID=80878 RepID=UPI000CA39482|nr:hypothetical protein [uncultured bacterium]